MMFKRANKQVKTDTAHDCCSVLRENEVNEFERKTNELGSGFISFSLAAALVL